MIAPFRRISQLSFAVGLCLLCSIASAAAQVKEFVSGQVVITPQAYGAKGDAVADDTVPMNRAAAAALELGKCLYLGNGQYKITSTLRWYIAGATEPICVFGDETGIVGRGAQILWYGPTNGIAVQTQRTVHFTLRDFAILNKVSRGSTVGILFTSESLYGSQTGPAEIMNLLVDSFYEDVDVGASAGRAADSIAFDNLSVSNANSGIALRASNTLNITFNNLLMARNAKGLDIASGPNSVWVFGGSATGNTITDFYFGSSDTLGIFGFRSESENRFLQCAPASVSTPVTVVGAMLNASSNPDGVLIEGLGGACNLHLDSNVVLGKIRPKSPGQNLATLVMTNNQVYDTIPFAPANANGLRYTLIDNNEVNGTGSFVARFPNATGIVVDGRRVDAFSVSDCAVADQNPCTAGGGGSALTLTSRTLVMGGSPPTASGTCPVKSQIGGNTAGTFTASGACSAGTYIFTFDFEAPNGWVCEASDHTTSPNGIRQTASSKTTATFSATTANSDMIAFSCVAY